MRTKITTEINGHVTITYEDDCGERVSREFFLSRDPGYVRELDSRQTFPQVCERLASTGNTLMCSRDELEDTIRREYRRMRRARRAEMLPRW